MVFTFDARQRGFTLTELMITIAIIAIVSAFALPMLGNVIASFRVYRSAQNYASTFNFGRMEAIRRNLNVYVCGAAIRTDGTPNGCAANWSQAAMAYADAPSATGAAPNNAFNSGEQIRLGQVTTNSSGSATVKAVAQTIPLTLDAVSNNPTAFILRPNGHFASSTYTTDGQSVARIVFQDVLKPAKCKVVWMDSNGRANLCTASDLAATGSSAATLCNPKAAALLPNAAAITAGAPDLSQCGNN